MDESTSKRQAVSDRVVFRLPTKAADTEEEDFLKPRPLRQMRRMAWFQVWSSKEEWVIASGGLCQNT